MVRLWCHEVLRVFHDRLVTDEERSWCKQTLKRMTEQYLEVDFTQTFSHLDLDGNGDIDEEELRHLIFTDFDPGLRQYSEVMELNDIVPQVETYLDDYNLTSHKPLRLVLFLFAVEHVARIARVLRQPQGNALLVGVGGSGRQSLTRLAAHIGASACMQVSKPVGSTRRASPERYEVVQVEMSRTYGPVEWRDDIKKLLRRAGVDGCPIVFLLSDSQMKDESFYQV
jgi:dynein heavy chain